MGETVATPIEEWVEKAALRTRPKQVGWCDGSEAEARQMVETLVAEGRTVRLNERTYPNCILHRSDPSDVARTEQVTFICSRRKEDAGPTNNWMAPEEAKQKVGALFNGAMKDRTMYVVPYLMGPADSHMTRVGVEGTDSPYVVVRMHIMARIGKAALERSGKTTR